VLGSPGWRIGAGECPRAALLRELKEEIPGINNVIVGTNVFSTRHELSLPDRNGLVPLFYLVRANLPVLSTLSDEHDEHRWVAAHELNGLSAGAPLSEAYRNAAEHT